MLNSDKNEVLTLFKSEELAGILECLKKHKLTKRFGRLFTLLNRVATDFFDLSPITGKKRGIHNRTSAIDSNRGVKPVKLTICNGGHP